MPAKKSKHAPNLYLKRGTWWYAKQVNGVRPWVNLQTGDEAEAIRRVRELEHSPLLRIETTGLRAEVAQFIDYKVKKREYSRDSASTKVVVLEEFSGYLDNSATSATVRPADCANFYAALQERVSESTAEGYMMTLRSFFRWAVEVKRTRLDNPIAKVEVVRAEHIARKRFADKKTKNHLIAVAPNDDLRFIAYCGFDAGLRRGEISEARADWFELDYGGSLHVQRSVGSRLREGEREWRPKYNKERVIPLTRPFRKFLKRYLQNRDPLDFALMPEVKHGTWRYRYDIRRPFSEWMETEGMIWITPHVMRHSFASILKSKGKSNAKISEWMGNSERVTERTYAHLKPDDRDVHVLT
ncbi:MAG: site-specific integrase [Verrucomicrobiaceae bacterium]|nr:site-specific integrase [Verrucomicrobiaceae bacterium]